METKNPIKTIKYLDDLDVHPSRYFGNKHLVTLMHWIYHDMYIHIRSTIYIYVYMCIYIDYIYIHVTKYPATTRIRIPTPLIQLRLVTQAPFQATPPSRMHQLGRRRGTDGANINVPTGGIIPELREVAG